MLTQPLKRSHAYPTSSTPTHPRVHYQHSQSPPPFASSSQPGYLWSSSKVSSLLPPSLPISLLRSNGIAIIIVITNLSGAWAYSTFGFISIPLLVVPFILFKFGAQFRAKSAHGHARTSMMAGSEGMMTPMKAGGKMEA